MSTSRKMIQVMTADCSVCKTRGTIEVDEERYNAWRAGTFIQDAFPDMDKALREQLISGIHPSCWERLWGKGLWE